MDPAQVRRADQQPVEGLRDEPAAEQDLDIVDRPVGEALDREVDDARARRRRAGSGRDPAARTRADRIGLTAIASGTPPARCPGPTAAGRRSLTTPPVRELRPVAAPARSSGSGVPISAAVGQRLRAVPDARQRGPATRLGDGADEALALLVLLDLQVHAR